MNLPAFAIIRLRCFIDITSMDEKKIEIVTPHSIEEINSRLIEVTTKPRNDALLSFKERHLKDMYHGNLALSGFKLQRLVMGRTVVPRLIGKYTPSDSSTIITITTNSKELVTSAVGVVIGLMLPVVTILLTMCFISSSGVWVIPVIALIGIAMYGYIYSLNRHITEEIERDRKTLSRLLDA